MNSPEKISPGILQAPVSRRVMNLGDLLTQSARRLPGRDALVWNEQIWSYGELLARVDALAHALDANGISKGDRVLVQARNSNQMFETQYACFKSGAVWVPVNFRLAPEEVAYIASASGAKVLIYDDVFADHRDAAFAATATLETIICIGTPGEGEHQFDELVDAHLGAPFQGAPVVHDDACWFFFTSGTTGHPKGAILTHGQLTFITNNYLADLLPGVTEDEASLVVAPMSHAAGIHQLAVVARGGLTVMLSGSGFHVEEVYGLIETYNVTNLFAVPTIVTLMMEGDAAERFDHSSLKHILYAGAPMYRADQKQALGRLGKCLTQFYGLGEVTCNIAFHPACEHDVDDEVQGRIGTCGYARTGMEIAIFDDVGKRLGPGETGEICVIGPAVFAGYYQNEEANAKAFRDGWFRTGDLGHMDEAGYVYITGRASDMFISGGSNIYPREIEEKILEHPGVAETALVGVPDAKWGEVGAVVLVPHAGSTIDIAEFKSWLGERVARYKVPKFVAVWPELPKSGYGKVPKRLVRDEMFAKGVVPLEVKE